jgi:hypothetical protein
MHARIDQLLSLRDDEPLDAAARAHIAACHECSEALARLDLMRRRLKALPTLGSSPVGSWATLKERVEATRGTAAPVRRPVALAVAASIVAVALLGILRLVGSGVAERDAATTHHAADPVVNAAADAAVERDVARHMVAELQQQSRVLEEVLAALPARPAVERAGTALPIETLQAQVQWLDHQLTVSGADDSSPAATERLWRDRVEIMNSLVQLRYVEAQRVAL